MEEGIGKGKPEGGEESPEAVVSGLSSQGAVEGWQTKGTGLGWEWQRAGCPSGEGRVCAKWRGQDRAEPGGVEEGSRARREGLAQRL